MTSKYYAIAKGKQTGIFTSWTEVQPLVNSFPGAIHKSFKLLQDAEQYLKSFNISIVESDKSIKINSSIPINPLNKPIITNSSIISNK